MISFARNLNSIILEIQQCLGWNSFYQIATKDPFFENNTKYISLWHELKIWSASGYLNIRTFDFLLCINDLPLSVCPYLVLFCRWLFSKSCWWGSGWFCEGYHVWFQLGIWHGLLTKVESLWWWSRSSNLLKFQW